MEKINGYDDSSLKAFQDELGRLPSYSKEENLLLLNDYRKNPTIELRNQIVEGNLRLVYTIAFNNSRKYHLPTMDFVQEGSLGLISAVEHFDHELQVPFSNFASIKIQNAIYDYMTNYSFVISIPRYIYHSIQEIQKAKNELYQKLSHEPSNEEIAAYLGEDYTAAKILNIQILYNRIVSLDENISSDENEPLYRKDLLFDEDDPSKRYKMNEMLNFYKEALSKLPQRSREIFLERTKMEHPATLEELSKRFRVSKERIRQIEEDCVLKMQNYILKKL